MEPASPTDRLTRAYADIGFDDLPESTVTAASRVLLDATGVMLAASGMAQEVAPFVSLAGTTPGPCAILGTGSSAAAPMAALANGAMAHALDYEDAFDSAPGHPNASLVPALLALTQHRGGIDGRRLLTALAVGCDVSCRIALALDRPMEAGGWYPPPITAAFGAALGGGHLLGLNAKGLRDSLSLMLCQAVMPGEIKYSRGTVLRAVREAFPAQAAVLCGELAAEGVAGFETPLEGRSGFYALYAGGEFAEQRLAGGIGDHFHIEDLTFKPWPSCRGTHPFIEIGLQLAQEIGDPAQIAGITVEVSPVQQMLVEPADRKRAPEVVIDAKFSIPFAMALAIVRGRVGLDNFNAASLADPAILAMAARIDTVVVECPAVDGGAGGAALVQLADGQHFRREIAVARGSPDRPVTEEALIAKFVDCAGRARVPLSPAVGQEMAERILSIRNHQDAGAIFR